jgi:hypothetical protein
MAEQTPIVDLAAEPAAPAAPRDVVTELQALLNIAHAYYNRNVYDTPGLLAAYRALVAAIRREFGRQPGDSAHTAARNDARAARIVHAASIPLCLRSGFDADSVFLQAAFPAICSEPDQATADLCLVWGVGREYGFVRKRGIAAAWFVKRLRQVAAAFPARACGAFGWDSQCVRAALEIFARAGRRLTLAELIAETGLVNGDGSAAESATLVFAFAPGKVVSRDADAVAGTYAYANPRGAALLRLAAQGDPVLALSAALTVALSESSDPPCDGLAAAIIAALRA